jgi:hypothetical protein
LLDAIFRWKAVRPDFAISIGPSKILYKWTNEGRQLAPFFRAERPS